MGEGDNTLSIDVINEDPAHPGPIGSTQVQLSKIFEAGRFEDWVPLTSTTGGPLGHIFMRLNFTVSSKPNIYIYIQCIETFSITYSQRSQSK